MSHPDVLDSDEAWICGGETGTFAADFDHVAFWSPCPKCLDQLEWMALIFDDDDPIGVDLRSPIDLAGHDYISAASAWRLVNA